MFLCQSAIITVSNMASQELRLQKVTRAWRITTIFPTWLFKRSESLMMIDDTICKLESDLGISLIEANQRNNELTHRSNIYDVD